MVEGGEGGGGRGGGKRRRKWMLKMRMTGEKKRYRGDAAGVEKTSDKRMVRETRAWQWQSLRPREYNTPSQRYQ